MSGHTPGPWQVDHETRGGEICTIHSLPDSFGNGQGWTYIYGENRYPADAEQVANACLIAAAPDLLAELKRLVAALEPLERDGNWPLDGAGIATLNAARAAIAAAEPKP